MDHTQKSNFFIPPSLLHVYLFNSFTALRSSLPYYYVRPKTRKPIKATLNSNLYLPTSLGRLL